MDVGAHKLVPTDLREWIGSEKIIAWIEQSIEEMDRATVFPVRRGFSGGTRTECSRIAAGRWVSSRLQSFRTERVHDCTPFSIDRRRLFSLLGFSYTAGIFSSQEIIRQCYKEFWFRHCSGQVIPFRTELISFRRRERVGLELVLTRVLGSALSAVCEGRLGRGEMREIAIEEAKGRIEIARHMDSCDE